MKLTHTVRLLSMIVMAALAAAVGTASGCGGVGGGGTGGFGATVNFTHGPITGFGSIIVGGVRFEDSQATIEDDEGGSRTRDGLKLGVTVSVDSTAVTDAGQGPQATASVVRLGSVLVGPLESVSSVSLTALGQTVQLSGATIIDDSLGALTSLPLGTVVEVHGAIDPSTQTIVATRVEAASQPVTSYKVRGVARNVDTAARTLRIGSSTFVFSAASDVPTDLADGRTVTLRVGTTRDAAGAWTVVRVSSAAPLSVPRGDRESASVRGVVTSFSSLARFVVVDTTVDASNATFPDGSGIAAGSRVKVEGRFLDGVLVAAKVEIDSDERVRTEGIDLRGAIESVDAAASTFRLRGATVSYAGDVEFRKGGAGDLAVGRQVRVQGEVAGDRTRVQAKRIEFL
jgi:hypothetical protein